MVEGIRWQRKLPMCASDTWAFLHRPNGLQDAVVTIDATNDQMKYVAANDAARAYLDQVDDGSALTQITRRYTDAREQPVSLTLARRGWRLSELEDEVQDALDLVLSQQNVDLGPLCRRTHELRRRLDGVSASLAALDAQPG